MANEDKAKGAEALLGEIDAAEPQVPATTDGTAPAGQTGTDLEKAGRNINAMLNVGLNVQVILGQARMPISQILELQRGSVIELDKKIGAPVDLVINDRLVARGDLVKVGEDRLGVTLTEIVKDYVTDL